MWEPSDTHSVTRFRSLATETIVGGLVLTAILAITIALSGTGSRLSHPLWLDECITSLVANDPALTHALAAIRGGVENNPPTYYLILWPISRAFGGLGTVGLRLFAGLSMILALTGLYAICRLYFTRERAMLGALAAAAHPMVIAQIFEVRFYGAWLAASVWFAFAMLLPTNERNSRQVAWVRVVLAVIVATMHWFGSAVVLLIVATDLVRTRKNAKERRSRAMPLAYALVATALCLPFLIEQRTGLTVSTWIDPTTRLTVARLAYRIFVNPSMLLVAGYVVVRVVGRARPEYVGRRQLPPFVPLLSLLLFPVVIVCFSLLVQPTIYERYLIVVVAPLAVLVAWAALPAGKLTRRAPRVAQRATVVAVAGLGMIAAIGREMRRYNGLTGITDWRIRNAIAATDRIVAQAEPLPVVFARRFEQYPVIQQRPDLASSIALIDFDGIPDPSLMRRTVFERDMARRVAKFYDQYRLLNVDVLRTGGPFYVITSANEVNELRRLLAGFEVVAVAPDVYYVQR